MNRWTLTDEVKEKYTPMVEKFIQELEDYDSLEDYLTKDFSDTELNPYTLWIILESLGYEKDNLDTNGWELDFEITFIKEGFKPIAISGCGMTFELKLSEVEEY